MTMGVVVCRPEPGNAATAARARALGLTAKSMPLFAVAPIAWAPPDPADFDAIMLTSANAIRHGGAGLDTLKVLPVVAVGEETAAVARGAGFTVAATGTQDAAALAAFARGKGYGRLLHLAGRERTPAAGIETITVYGSDPLPIARGATRALADGWIVLLHSIRAAERFAELVARDGTDRPDITIAAFSDAVRDAVGPGWGWAQAASRPTDEALLDLARAHAIDRSPHPADKADMDDALAPLIVEPAQPTGAAPRGWRFSALLLLIAFIAGLAVMALTARYWNRWFGPATPVAATAPAGTQSVATVASQTVPAPINDLPTLTARENQLGAQIASLEARAAAITASANQAAGYAGRAEGLMIAFAARRAIDRGLALGYIEGQLSARFGATQPRAVATVLQAAREPVTIEDLRTGLDGVAPMLTSGGTNISWWQSFTREIGNLVVIHKADAPSPLPTDRLARARRMLEAGQVEPALAEVSRMPGANAAQGWIDAARRYVEARHALDALENAAVAGQAADTTPTPAS